MIRRPVFLHSLFDLGAGDIQTLGGGGYLTGSGGPPNLPGAGQVGFLNSLDSQGPTAISLTNATAASCAQISGAFPVGLWMIWYGVTFTMTGATVTLLQCGLNTVGAALAASGVGQIGFGTLASNAMNLTTFTGVHTVYGVVRNDTAIQYQMWVNAQANFSAGTVSCGAQFYALRRG